MRCYEGALLYWTVCLGPPSLLIYVFGFPIPKFVAVYKRRHRLEDDHTKAKYGFLINGFNPGTYYWEVVVDARKLLMSAIAVFPGAITPRPSWSCCSALHRTASRCSLCAGTKREASSSVVAAPQKTFAPSSTDVLSAE